MYELKVPKHASCLGVPWIVLASCATSHKMHLAQSLKEKQFDMTWSVTAVALNHKEGPGLPMFSRSVIYALQCLGTQMNKRIGRGSTYLGSVYL